MGNNYLYWYDKIKEDCQIHLSVIDKMIMRDVIDMAGGPQSWEPNIITTLDAYFLSQFVDESKRVRSIIESRKEQQMRDVQRWDVNTKYPINF